MSKKHPEYKGVNCKRVYSPPRLTRYGALRLLTQSGSGTAQEATGGGGTCSKDLNRYPCVPSDPATKQDIIRIGDHLATGVGIYLFNYKPEFRDEWGQGRQFGVMADEVETVMPQAVCTHPDGYKMVDYALLGITRFIR